MPHGSRARCSSAGNHRALIARIQAAKHPGPCRFSAKLTSHYSGWQVVNDMKSKLAIAGLVLVCLGANPAASQQQAGEETLVGSWAGTLVIGRDSFEMTFNLTRQGEGYGAALISRQLGIYGMPAELVRLENNRLTIRLDMLGAEYTGRLRLDESSSRIAFIDGEWFQEGEMVPIILRPAGN